MDAPAIALEGVSHRFDQRLVLEDLSFEAPAGTVFGFLGPNGAGKTTTINLLLGLLELQQGRMTVLGTDVTKQPGLVRASIGALLEYDGLYEQLSASDNLEFYGRAWRLPEGERENRVHELLAHMQLWDRRDEPVSRWSRGMRRRLGLTRALLHRPSVIILDEPTAGLDVVNANQVHQDLESLVEREHVTVFLTTHNMVEAQRLCDSIAVIRAGKIIGLGKPDELRSRARIPTLEINGRDFPANTRSILERFPFIGTVKIEPGRLQATLMGDADTSAVVTALVEAGARIEGVRQESASLEEAFLALVGNGVEGEGT